MAEALLYKKLENKIVQCNVCFHRCKIALQKRGICGVRENRNGKLFLLVYGKAIAEHLDPIEKKPFFHFLPGTHSLSIATVGCNFRCKNCQNWDISQGPKLNREIQGFELSPEKIVEEALRQNAQSISYTYTEPTIFMEYALDTMKLAKEKGLKNNWVTNGFMTKETLELIIPYLDAVNVDLKSFSDKFYKEICGGELRPILDNLKYMKDKGIWVEVTTLVIPTLNDTKQNFEKIADFIRNELGIEVPWHISRFSPEISWKLQDLPSTPEETIHQAREIGIKKGLKYVYSGNLFGNDGENTYCPKCGKLAILRTGFAIQRFDDNGKCKECGESLDLIL